MRKQEFRSQISDIPKDDWEKLFAFIPAIENTRDFGKWTDADSTKGVAIMPHYSPSIVVSDFIRTAYAIDLVLKFDWMRWDEGQEILSDPMLDYDTLDVLTLSKLLTTILRNERFSEGYMKRCFEDGLVLKILKSMESMVLN